MSEKITFEVTDQKEEITFSFSEAARGPQGEPGAAATVDQTIIDGSANAVSGNAVFDGLALKAPLANPTFTGIVTAPRITGRCDGLEVFCKASLAINAGQVVYVTGASGNNIIIGLAQANAEATSSKTIGISESTLATNGTGYVITEGLMTVSISAPSAIEGDPIWLSPSTAGGMVFGAANKPVAPNHMVYLGVITRKTGNNVVEIYVKIQNGSELDELSDVLITSPTAGQALMRGATLWENRSLVATDISDSTTAGRALLTAADAAAQRTSLGLGTAATTASTDYATAAQGTDERVPTAAGLTTKFGTAKATPVDADKVAILDSAASDAPKHSTLTAIWTWIQSKFAGASSKTTPIDADSFNIVDSADSNAAKRVTGTNLKAFLKTYLDTLYVALTGNQTIAGDKTLSGNTVINGNLTVDGTTFYVNATDNRVGVGTTTPSTHGGFHVVGGISTFGGQTVTQAKLGSFSGYAAVWLSDPGAAITPDFSNYNFLKDTDAVIFNAPSGDVIKFRIANGADLVTTSTTGTAISGTLTVGGTNTWNGSTIAGAQAFSSTTRPTSSGTGTPASNSLVTSADVDAKFAKVSAYKSTDQTALTTGAYNKITFDTEVYDTASAFASSTFTAPVAGYVQVNVSVYKNGTTGADALAIYKNGTQHKRLMNHPIVRAATIVNGTATIQVAANDTLEIYYFAQNATDIIGASTITWVMFTMIP